MGLESKELIQDEFKIRSDGLVNALKQDKLMEAREYILDIRNSLDLISDYLNAQIHYREEALKVTDQEDARNVARSEAEIAFQAAKRAEEKAERLNRASKETAEDSKRFKKAARHAKRDANYARKAAEKAGKAERKATEDSTKAWEHADKANEAARRS